MPKRIFHKKRPTFRKKTGYKKKTYHKKRAPRATNHITSLTLHKGVNQMFPDRLCVKMKNEFVVNFVGSAGATNAVLISANGLSNPLSTVLSGATGLTAGQPTSIYGLGNILGTDTAFASTGPYSNYRVISSAYRCDIQNTSATVIESATLVCIPVDTNTVGAMGNINAVTQSELVEFPYSKYRTISGQTTNRGVTLKGSMSTARMYALKYRASLEDPAYYGSVGSNPQNQWYWVWYWFPQTAGNTSACMTVKIEYWVEFFNRNTLKSTQG